jgi:alkylation response protein AidB-like acyl-CoA dehydrogenase
MSELAQMIGDSLRRLLQDLAPLEKVQAWEAGEELPGLWEAVQEAGLPLLLVPEAAGGAGGGEAEAIALARVCGECAAPIPLVETVLANKLIAAAGWDVELGAKTIAVACDLIPEHPVPWLAAGTPVVAVGPGDEVSLLTEPVLDGERRNLAGEPMAALRPDRQAEPARRGRLEGLVAKDVLAEAALLRAAQMSGAMVRLIDMTQDHVSTREQFGRPLNAFQSVQHQLAVAAGHAAAAGVAVDAAAVEGDRFLLSAMAKARASEAAGLVAATAYQLHGAMGFTRDYPLNLLARRCLAWREEYGSETLWHEWIGRAVASQGGDELWPMLTTLG